MVGDPVAYPESVALGKNQRLELALKKAEMDAAESTSVPQVASIRQRRAESAQKRLLAAVKSLTLLPNKLGGPASRPKLKAFVGD